MRKSGILLNISSLPSPYGIGGLGKECRNFADKLHLSGCSLWQILPLTSIGLGNSPYSGLSAFAGNYLYIDPADLLKRGLIDKATHDKTLYTGSPFTADYAFATFAKKQLIESVYLSKKYDDKEFAAFVKENAHWLTDYAIYMSIKSDNNGSAWWEWQEELKLHDTNAIANYKLTNADKITYYYLEQYLFDLQWRDTVKYLHSVGVKIVGDMPIYVSLDSCDVWANRDQFSLDSNMQPKCVAGVPPDYFAEKGQLWGNPIYNYMQMRKDNFKWFTSRIERMFKLYDICRFDHFRAVAEYWAVPYGAEDARGGKWIAGGGADMLKAITASNNGEIIAEDLGIIDNKVEDLRVDFKLKGMRVMQFGFDGDDSSHTPHNFTKDSVAYTGTHDNNTLFGWLYELSPTNRNNLLDYIGETDHTLKGGKDSPQIWSCIRALLTSVADYAIIPFQDLLGWGGDTRMNIPGVAENNWRIRISDSNIDEVDWKKLHKLNYLSKRM